jgi:uncharacterized membrane protein
MRVVSNRDWSSDVCSSDLYSILAITYAIGGIGMLVIPYMSKIYGIERLWIQSLVVLAPCLMIGYSYLLSKIRLPIWTVFIILGMYVYFNCQFGLIKSIIG